MRYEYGHSLPREVIEAQRMYNGVINATLKISRGPITSPWTYGDIMRDILRQAHDCFLGAPHLDGAWYVLRCEYGGLMLCPFGWNKWRDRFWCRPDRELGLWIFEVVP